METITVFDSRKKAMYLYFSGYCIAWTAETLGVFKQYIIEIAHNSKKPSLTGFVSGSRSDVPYAAGLSIGLSGAS